MNNPPEAEHRRVAGVGDLCLLPATPGAVVAPKGSSTPGLAASEPPCPQLWPLPRKQAGLSVSRTAGRDWALGQVPGWQAAEEGSQQGRGL